jgi:riboflavin kinase
MIALLCLLLLVSPCLAFSNDNLSFTNVGSRLFSSAADDVIEPPSRARLLPNVLRYRGSVDQGYGRGGKKLGVPTANLPSSLFQNALEEVTTGVYFGWAALERSENNGNYELHKAVVNVGYSPTFEGEENREKIIEAHLIVEQDREKEAGSTDVDGEETENRYGKTVIEDFYGIPMSLQLIGFLREEKKFDSFPELIAQINADVKDAKLSLDCQPYKFCRADPFFCKTSPAWIGSGGGDEIASWESAPIETFLDSIK